MNPYFAVFNSHVNDAKVKAKQMFIELHGQKKWDEQLQPFLDKGAMSIFDEDPNQYTRAYVLFIWMFVNHEELNPEEKAPAEVPS